MPSSQSEVERTLGLHRRAHRGARAAGAIGVLVLLGVGLWLWVASSQRNATVHYVTAAAQISDFSVTMTATGTIEPTHLVEISSELSGTLKSVHVDYNDVVDVGTVLAELDTIKLEAQLAVRQAGLASAVARVAMARATLDEAQTKYDTALNLEERGITAHQTFVSQRAAFMRAQAEEQSAIADRALAQANLDLQQAELEKACICSPIRGVVLDRAVDAGQIVASALSAPLLFTVAEDLTNMELQVDIDEADIGLVALMCAVPTPRPSGFWRAPPRMKLRCAPAQATDRSRKLSKVR